eukprot:CAMPEP_0174281710 /NCGR_PEP_ID=MMETSP0809-20121228/2108_1 /TAXON_ID=73025 ORGANISM="Eutreptiella gymnastica-like, Strain CCMP1594" /NCGR_SAMPLE_ID=MMETSP0809 /ASSEMBLY_ACC=CAM_ASM_000658 /LENGTH=44 /DNA_ID= /DNA_START= /DNA_END= /DNA_ORIENTATION=
MWAPVWPSLVKFRAYMLHRSQQHASPHRARVGRADTCMSVLYPK